MSPGWPYPQPTATVVFNVRQENRYQLISDLIGTSTVVSTGTTPAVLRSFPFRYPPSPNLICRSIDSIDFYGSPSVLGVGLPWLAKRNCWVTATFGPATFDDTGQFDVSGQPYTQTSIGVGVDKLTIPNSVYRFIDGAPTNTNVAINLPTLQINMRRLMLPFAPLAVMTALAGSVNAAPITWPFVTYATGTLLFMGGNIELTFNTDGSALYQTDYQLMWRFYDWNWYLHPRSGVGFAPIADSLGNTPYPYGDLSQLP